MNLIRRKLRQPALVVACALGLLATPASAVIYTVTNLSHDQNVAGSLPWAVNQANWATPGFDYIVFNIPANLANSAGQYVIGLSDQLFLRDQTAIRGDTQPGYNGVTPKIVIKCNGAPTAFNLSEAGSSVSTIQALNIYDYTENGITVMEVSQGNWILNNWVGFAFENGVLVRTVDRRVGVNGIPVRGIGIQSAYNVIDGNTVSGVDNGIFFTLAAIEYNNDTTPRCYRNTVRNNKIGTDHTGNYHIGNTGDGIFLGVGAGQNWIGPNNIVCGNASVGIELLHVSCIGNVIFGNYVGITADGWASIPNGEVGIYIGGGSNTNAIGGPFGGNYIAGNRLANIVIGDGVNYPGRQSAVHNTWIQWNVIGMNPWQAFVLRGAGQNMGINIAGGSTNVVIENNVIAGHYYHGIDANNSSYISVNWNWIGQASWGGWVANGGFGLWLNNCYYIWNQGNAYGQNGLGIWFNQGGWNPF